LHSVKLYNSLCIALSVATLITSAPVTTLAQYNTPDDSSSIVHELRKIKALLEKESSPFSWSSIRDAILTLLSIATAVFVAYRIFRLDQETKRKNIIRRSCETLQRELGQAIESFERGERIYGSYYEEPPGLDPIIRGVDYNSAIIITDSYESILHSAFFTEFSAETQDVLSTVYDRIRTHNRLVLSIGQFEKQTPKMLEYQVFLTGMEREIITLLHPNS
jgi:hypothetical protein